MSKYTITTVSTIHDANGQPIQTFKGKVEVQSVEGAVLFDGMVTTAQSVLEAAHRKFLPTEEEQAVDDAQQEKTTPGDDAIMS